MPTIPARFLIHRVTAETLKGHGPSGPVYLPAGAPVPCVVSERVRNIRASDGTVTVSTATVTVPTGHAPAFAPDSRVHLPSGRVTRVLAYLTHDAGALGPWSHGEVVCE